jgi:hypothetical protein
MRSVLLAVMSLLVVHASPRLTTDDVDPPLRLVLRIDDQEHQLVDGQEAVLTLDGKQRKVKATVSATRCFDAAGVLFEFPRDMALSFDHDADLPTWRLAGGKVTLMLFTRKERDTGMAATILAGQAVRLGIDVDAPGSTTLNLGGVTHQAHELRLPLHGTNLHVVAADIAGTGVTVYVQDSMGDGQSTTADCQHLLDLLATTWKTTAPK